MMIFIIMWLVTRIIYMFYQRDYCQSLFVYNLAEKGCSQTEKIGLITVLYKLPFSLMEPIDNTRYFGSSEKSKALTFMLTPAASSS